MLTMKLYISWIRILSKTGKCQDFLAYAEKSCYFPEFYTQNWEISRFTNAGKSCLFPAMGRILPIARKYLTCTEDILLFQRNSLPMQGNLAFSQLWGEYFPKLRNIQNSLPMQGNLAFSRYGDNSPQNWEISRFPCLCREIWLFTEMGKILPIAGKYPDFPA